MSNSYYITPSRSLRIDFPVCFFLNNGSVHFFPSHLLWLDACLSSELLNNNAFLWPSIQTFRSIHFVLLILRKQSDNNTTYIVAIKMVR